MHQPRTKRWLIATPPVAAVLALVVLFACQDTDTLSPDLAKGGVQRYTLAVSGAGTGTVASNRGGLTCTITGGRLSGSCTQQYKAGTIVNLTAAPGAGQVLVSWQGLGCVPTTDSPLTCRVTMSQNRSIAANFGAAPNSFGLTISGGAAGGGTVTSNIGGISCTMSGGNTSGVCSATYAANQSVTLTATRSGSSFLKSWAGGGCDVNGSGVGSTTGTCTVVLDQPLSVIVSFDPSAVVASMGEWSSPIPWDAVAIHSFLLPNGLVMTWGQMDHVPVLWDYTTGAFSSAERPVNFFCSGHAFLPNGKLFVAGGHSGTNDLGIRNSEYYDFATNQWTPGPTMQNGRWYPSNLTLANGEVLTISGGDTIQALNTMPEVLQTNGQWRVLSTADFGRPYFPMEFVAPDGRVFEAGPDAVSQYLTTSGTGRWDAGPQSHAGYRDYGTAVMYDAGKVLLVGGGNTPTSSAEKIDLNAGSGASWQPAGSMAVPRRQLNATILADGTVLVTGGSNAAGFNVKPTNDAVLAAERWNPNVGTTGQWTALQRMGHYRLYHSTALLLPDARVISVGSGQPAATGLGDDLTAEIFSPPYLFKADGSVADRPTMSSVPLSVTYNETFTVQTPDPASIAKITWIRLSAVTHSFNQNQRLNYLNFAPNGPSSLAITAPFRRELAPPGHYMLFLVNASGVPSVATIVRIQ